MNDATPMGLRDSSLGALRALVGALSRGRCLFWTGHVLVELDRDFDPAEEGVGAVTMVLDQDDFAALKTLADQEDDTAASAYEDAVRALAERYPGRPLSTTIGFLIRSGRLVLTNAPEGDHA